VGTWVGYSVSVRCCLFLWCACAGTGASSNRLPVLARRECRLPYPGAGGLALGAPRAPLARPAASAARSVERRRGLPPPRDLLLPAGPRPPSPPPDSAPGVGGSASGCGGRAGPGNEQAAQPDSRLQPWSMLLACPLLVALVLGITRQASGTRPHQLGLTTHRLTANLGLGVLAGLVATPAVNALHAGVSWLLLEGFQIAPEEHGLTRLAQQGLCPLEWTVLVSSAVAAAPIMEELLFRGVLQRWLTGRLWGGDLCVAAALALAVILRVPAWSGHSYNGV